MGSGSANVESLSSIIVGLAAEHVVSPRDLIRRLIRSAMASTIDMSAAFFRRHAHTMDGRGIYAKEVVDALAGLTLRSDLAALTLLPLKGVLPHNGSTTLRPHRAWCIACWQADLKAGRRCFGRLLWRIALVDACPSHQTILLTRCPHCSTRQPPIPRRATLNRCDRCNGSLLLASDDQQASDEAIAKARFVAGLIESQADIEAHGGREALLLRLSQLVGSHGLDRAHWCRSIGLQPRALNGWFNKGQRPSLELLCHIGLRTGLSAGELFGVANGTASLRFDGIGRSQRVRRHSTKTRTKAKRLLEAALRWDDPPRLGWIAQKARVSSAFLRYWFARDVDRLVAKRDAVRRRKSESRLARRLGELQFAVEGIKANGHWPTRRRVEKRLRAGRGSLAHSETRVAFRKLVPAAGPQPGLET